MMYDLRSTVTKTIYSHTYDEDLKINKSSTNLVTNTKAIFKDSIWSFKYDRRLANKYERHAATPYW